MMRTGFGYVEESQAEKDTEVKIVCLLRIFTRESLELAARYARAHGRWKVKDEDMGKTLRYVARTLLHSDSLQEKYEAELKAMQEEETSEEEDGEEEDGEEEDGEEEEGEEEEGEEEDGEEDGEEEQEKNKSFATKIDFVCDNWALWKPTDRIETLLKNAVDAAYHNEVQKS